MECTLLGRLPNQEIAINDEYNISRNEFNEMISMVKNWYFQQPHLPKEIDKYFDARIKFMLRSNKMSVEKTKKKLDMYYTVRNLFPEFFDDRFPKHPRIKKALDQFYIFPIEEPFDHSTRIVYCKIKDPSPDKFDFVHICALLINVLEIRMNFDLCVNDVYFVDYKNFGLGQVPKVNPIILAKYFKVFQNAFSDRIAGIHCINLPKYGQTVLNIIVSILKEKISNRIFIHENLDSLHKHIPKRFLPKEYGGDGRCIDDIQADWDAFMDKQTDWFLNQDSMRTNEKLRPEKLKTNELFGIDGTFRKLTID